MTFTTPQLLQISIKQIIGGNQTVIAELALNIFKCTSLGPATSTERSARGLPAAIDPCKPRSHRTRRCWACDAARRTGSWRRWTMEARADPTDTTGERGQNLKGPTRMAKSVCWNTLDRFQTQSGACQEYWFLPLGSLMQPYLPCCAPRDIETILSPMKHARRTSALIQTQQTVFNLNRSNGSEPHILTRSFGQKSILSRRTRTCLAKKNSGGLHPG